MILMILISNITCHGCSRLVSKKTRSLRATAGEVLCSQSLFALRTAKNSGWMTLVHQQDVILCWLLVTITVLYIMSKHIFPRSTCTCEVQKFNRKLIPEYGDVNGVSMGIPQTQGFIISFPTIWRILMVYHHIFTVFSLFVDGDFSGFFLYPMTPFLHRQISMGFFGPRYSMCHLKCAISKPNL